MAAEGTGKIPREVAKHLTSLNANELVVVPDEGDFGFEEYMFEKTRCIISRKRLHASIERNMLLLRYPYGENVGEDLKRFFASPKVRAESGNFEGCFAVDITDYKNRLDSENFRSLLSYMHGNRGIHFILLLFEKDKKKAEKVYSFLNSNDYFDYVTFNYPTAARLAEYIAGRFSKYTSEQISVETCNCIRKLLGGGKYEYDYADRLVDELIYTGCSADSDEIQKTLTDVLFRKKANAENSDDTRKIGFVSTAGQEDR